MLIDTHAHLYSTKFDDDREAMLDRSRAAGITHCLLPNVDSASLPRMLALERAHPDYCFPMAGLHPVSVKGKTYRGELAVVRKELERRPYLAVGEIGLDFYWDKTFQEEQEEAFLTQVGWAAEFDLPIVIHARDSIDRLTELLAEKGTPRIRGVFHCFTGNLEQAERIIELGFYLGLGGVLTYKNGGLDQVVPHLPLDRLLLETDAPYLAPVPKRGKRNESSYVAYVAERLANLLEKEIKEIAELTSGNARQLFDIDGFTERRAAHLDGKTAIID